MRHNRIPEELMIPLAPLDGREDMLHVIKINIPNIPVQIIPFTPVLAVPCGPDQFVRVGINEVNTGAINQKAFTRKIDSSNLVTGVFDYITYDISVVDKQDPLDEYGQYFTRTTTPIKFR